MHVLKFSSSSLLISSLLTLIACGDGGNSDKVSDKDNIKKSTEFKTEIIAPIDTFVTVQVLDGATGESIDTDVSLNLMARDSDLSRIVDAKGKSFADDGALQMKSGIASLSLAQGNNVSSEDPISFRVIASAPNFVSSSKNVTLSEVRQYNIDITLTSTVPERATEGTSVFNSKVAGLELGGMDPAGKTDTLISIETPEEPTNRVKTQVDIAKGTKILSAEGEPLVGELSASLVFHNNQTNESLSSLPGGLQNVSVINESGEMAEGDFISGGFISLEVTDQNGTQASSFDPPITINTSIPSNTINPDTGEPLQPGNKIPLWSYEPSTGEWSNEGPGLVLPATTDGNFPVSFAAKHLSYWNMDWYISGTERCTSSKINLRNTQGLSNSLSYQLSRTGGGWAKGKRVYDRNKDYFFKFYNIINDESLTLTAYLDGKAIHSQSYDDLCIGEDEVEFALPKSVVDDIETINIDYTVDKAECNGFTLEVPNGSLMIRPKSDNYSSWTYYPIEKDVNGNATVSLAGLVKDNAYQVKAYFTGQTIRKAFSNVATADFIASEDARTHFSLKQMCSEIDDKYTVPTISFKGNQTFNENTGTIELKINVKRNDGVISAKVTTFDLVLESSTALASEDFELFEGGTSTRSVTVNPNEEESIISIPVIDDTDFENDEYFSVSLQNIKNGNLKGGSQRVITIKDDDIATASLTSRYTRIEEGGSQTVTISLDKPAPADADIPIRFYNNYGRYALSGDDINIPQTISISAGQESVSFSVTSVDDSTAEENEYGYFTIAAARGIKISRNRWNALYIIDNDRWKKIDASGEVLTADAQEWACVKDAANNSVWEVKTDANKTEFYNSAQARSAYVHTLNESTYCGETNWSIPDYYDLRKLNKYPAEIVDDGSRMYIDTALFPNTQAINYQDVYFASLPDRWSWYSRYASGFLFSYRRGYGYPQYLYSWLGSRYYSSLPTRLRLISKPISD